MYSDKEMAPDKMGKLLESDDEAIAFFEKSIEVYEAQIKQLANAPLVLMELNPGEGTPEQQQHITHLRLIAKILRKQHGLIVRLEHQLNEITQNRD